MLPLYHLEISNKVMLSLTFFERASNVYFFIKKMLKIPTISEAVNQRGTCNAIAKKEKKTEKKQNGKQWSTKDYAEHIEQHKPY